jgi:hypothetical protein
MANELQILPNPDNVPGAVSSGYQRQNTNLFALQTGIDTTEPRDNGNDTITIPAGGIVEVNGSLFSVNSDVTLTKPVSSRAYWIAVTDGGDGLASFSLETRPGIWDSSKKGCYKNNNARTLNWVSLGYIFNSPTSNAYFSSPSVKGKHNIQLPCGWYYTILVSGKGKGDGGNASSSSVGSGGVSTVAETVTGIFFIKNTGNIFISIGADGENGGNGSLNDLPGTTDEYGGGGGSGGGEKTYIENIIYTDNVSPGKDGSNIILSTYPERVRGSHGIDGWYRPAGTNGGSCRIYQLGN